ncbi:MAG: AMP-binding protein [Sulfuricella sp.]|nr:AMP-binding protein [Sulfuricella sp.]
MQERLKGLSPEKRELLLKKLREKHLEERKSQGEGGESSIPLVPRSAPLPLSFAQERLWFLHELESQVAAAVYNIPAAYRLRGPLNVGALEAALNEIIRRHEVLRTSFFAENGQPFQRIAERLFLPLSVTDLPPFSGGDEESIEVNRIAVAYVQEAFDLATGPLLRWRLLRLARGADLQEEHILLVTMHHIVSDGWSTGVIAGEVTALYDAFAHGKPSPLAALPVQYADFAAWQRDRFSDGTLLESQMAYWRKLLEGAPPVLELPCRKPRPAEQTYRGKLATFQVGATARKGLEKIAQSAAATSFMTLLAAFGLLLSRYGGGDDLVIGSPIANRGRRELEPLIGFFVNTLAFRIDLAGNPTFQTLLERVKARALEAYTHQDLPFEKLVKELAPERNLSHAPLFQVMLVVQNAPLSRTSDDQALAIETVSVDSGVSHFDLVMYLLERDDGYLGILEYSEDLFEPAVAQGLLAHFQFLLEGIAANPHCEVGAYPLVADGEPARIMKEWSRLPREYSYRIPVEALFEERAVALPDAPALTFEGNTLSYAELNARANRLAGYLREKGVGPDSVVGLMMARSEALPVALLAILKAGGGYLPIDPEYPQERILAMLEDSGTALLLTEQRVCRDIPFTLLQQHRAVEPVITTPRPMVANYDDLPHPDRAAVSYAKYHQHIGIAPVRHTFSIEASRGCPYGCLYCHKIMSRKTRFRSAENIFAEISRCYAAGARRFVVVDDVFNLDQESSSRLLRKIIDAKLGIQLFFPNGLRGDILSKDYIDLLVEAGTVNLAVALESASPRIQRLIKKNLRLDRFGESVSYITETYPDLILEMQIMTGFPTETEEEAYATLDFVKNFHWLHFPNLHILKIYPDTEMEAMALEQGITREAIRRSTNLAYHELPDTLPFSKGFAREFQSRFMSDYFMDRERLKQVLPSQMKLMTEDELILKYDSYLPMKIASLADLLDAAGLTPEDLGGARPVTGDPMAAPDFDRTYVAPRAVRPDAPLENPFRILLLDLSLLFADAAEGMQYDMVEPPLGLMCLAAYLKQTQGSRVATQVAKSRIDFASFAELQALLGECRPQLVGIRTLSRFRDFFHETVSLLRNWLPGVPIVTGGPYASSEFATILANRSVDVVVLREGELTFDELVGKVAENGGALPSDEILETIQGIAFLPRSKKSTTPGREIVYLDLVQEHIDARSASNPLRNDGADSLAYLLYTSGSTGKPKGVAMARHALSNLIHWHLDQPAFAAPARTLQFAPYTFDVSFQEVFSTWSAGGTLHLASSELRRDALALLDYVERERIERLFLPYVALQQLATVAVERSRYPASLKEVITAGEQLRISPAIAGFFAGLENCRLHNHYGPSETHVVTAYTLEGDAAHWPALPSIGKPLANSEIYLLDPAGRPVPAGVPGELFVGGVALARGYLGQEALTAERFVANPFGGDGQRLYKTGDLALWEPDGNLKFLGRADTQVKIRGFRIEPGEIEALLNAHPEVGEAVVVDVEYGPGDRRLAAYVVASAGQEIDCAALRDYVKAKLPEYMVPSAFVALEQLPVTSSGKVDRRRLPHPGGDEKREAAVSPLTATPVEEVLAAIWGEVLKIDAIGSHDNFFELGGHSLLATQLISRIREAFALDIPVRQIFDTPTIQGLARHIEGCARQGGLQVPPILRVPRRSEYPLSFAQERLWFLDRLQGNSANYNMAAAIRIDGELDEDALRRSIAEIVRRHDVLRTTFHEEGGQPVAVIASYKEAPLPLVDIGAYPPDQQNAEVERRISSEAVTPFDLENGPLLKGTLLKLPVDGAGKGGYILLLAMHHIVADNWSSGVFIHELTQFYQAFHRQQTGAPLPELAVQYQDFACWQRHWLSGAALEARLDYWRKQLAGVPPLLQVSRRNAPLGAAPCRTASFALTRTLTGKIKKLCLHEGVSLYMALLAAYATLLFRYTGREDILVGSPIANRHYQEIEPLIGFFVNTLPMRVDLAGEPSYRDLLKRVRKTALEAFTHQDVPFEQIVREVCPERGESRTPLVQVVFALQNAPAADVPLDEGIAMTLLPTPGGAAKFDLILSMSEADGILHGVFEYDAGLFNADEVAAMVGHFGEILESAAAHPDAKVVDISLVAGGETPALDEAEEFNF